MPPPDPHDRAVLRRIADRVLRERGLLAEFSPPVLEEVSRLRASTPEAPANLRDLRELPWSSIDNDDSRDLDQLAVAVDDGDAVRVLVAIADVDARVRIGGAIDGHARANTTSVYTAAAVYPMLPEALSTDLTSLGPDEERLAIVVDMRVDPAGRVGASDVFRARVLNRAKLAYDGVAAWLDGTGPMPAAAARVPDMARQLRVQDGIAQAMKRQRAEQGMLSLQSGEARPVFDDGALVDLRPDLRNRARDLIEQFMIAANGVTARFLESRGYPSIRRVLGVPQRWDRVQALARAHGDSVPAAPDPAGLSAFLERRRQADPLRFPDLSLAVVKLLGRGAYAVETPGSPAPGHFGLAVHDYAHSTAPNRRFPDLVTQRLLKAALDGVPPPYDAGALSGLAAHCSVQEDNAAKAERQVRKSAAALLLRSRVGEPFDAIVTGASDKGTWVRTLAPPVEGRLVRGFQGQDIGDRLVVRLVHVDVERGYIDFERARR